MILLIKTDNPTAELYLTSQEGKPIDEFTWEAGRQLANELLKKLQEFLHKNKADFKDLTGVVVYSGPGSFTGLRIGITVANTIAYAQSIPIVGANGETWQQDGHKLIADGINYKIVMPHYGSEAHITLPKK